jgi:hypothetical protein
MSRAVLMIVLVAFGALTAVAVAQHGVLGIFAWQLQNTAGLQVLVDLVIALSLFLVWMWDDARRTGRNPWPWGGADPGRRGLRAAAVPADPAHAGLRPAVSAPPSRR